ncbi:unknown [[Mannheimia] succiniciproducens MBEL55E]|uniref:Uncharacterized protein n=1 Tax=Mannheimia succiniciproducens (strain KCTC 0769BP / MBEL55E) TaxID=221988 RepID=Q65V99_MANSM|nr:unknown [[Mannheimia] succiniciproducens MBEL55E]
MTALFVCYAHKVKQTNFKEKSISNSRCFLND